jgi:molecular chaperone DnaK (HSP70)
MTWDWSETDPLNRPGREPPARAEAVLPGDIGIRFPDNTKLRLFEAGARIPAQIVKVFTTTQNSQSNLSFHLVQYSEHSGMERDLGRFLVMGIAEAPKGDPQIELRLLVDDLGNLKVRARDRRLNLPMELKILYGKEEYAGFGVQPSVAPKTFHEIIIARITLRSG